MINVFFLKFRRPYVKFLTDDQRILRNFSRPPRRIPSQRLGIVHSLWESERNLTYGYYRLEIIRNYDSCKHVARNSYAAVCSTFPNKAI